MINKAKPLPFSSSLENKLLGQIFYKNSVMVEVNANIKLQDLYLNETKHIYIAMLSCYKDNIDIDIENVYNKLTPDVKEKIGLQKLIELQGSVLTEKDIKNTIKQIKDLSNRRYTLEKIIQLQEDLYDVNKEFVNEIGDLHNKLLQSVDRGNNSRHISEILDETVNEINDSMCIDNKNKGMGSGITDLDKSIDGLERSELIVIGARPSMGKTTLVCNIMEHVSKKHAVLFHSMEQLDTQLAKKLISTNTNINASDIKNGELSFEDLDKINAEVEDLKQRKLYIDQRAGLGIAEIESSIIKHVQLYDVEMVIIDYLQYMGIPNKNPVTEYSDIVKRLKTISKTYKLNIILLSQLSRAPEQRTDHRPILSDLRESGAIEQEGDKILLLYRDEYYHKDSEFKNILEVNIAKFRNGGVGTIELYFDKTKQRIRNLQR